MVDKPEDLTQFADLQRLIEITAERARAAQESSNTLSQILDGLRAISQILNELVVCARKTEGITLSMAAYLAKRNGHDLERLNKLLDAAEKDEAFPIQPAPVTVNVEAQSGGMKAGKFKASAGGDIDVAGGNIKGG